MKIRDLCFAGVSEPGAAEKKFQVFYRASVYLWESKSVSKLLHDLCIMCFSGDRTNTSETGFTRGRKKKIGLVSSSVSFPRFKGVFQMLKPWWNESQSPWFFNLRWLEAVWLHCDPQGELLCLPFWSLPIYVLQPCVIAPIQRFSARIKLFHALCYEREPKFREIWAEEEVFWKLCPLRHENVDLSASMRTFRHQSERNAKYWHLSIMLGAYWTQRCLLLGDKETTEFWPSVFSF